MYPGTSVDPSYVDPDVFKPIPPDECIKGRNSAWFRTGCEDDGYPTIVEIEVRLTQSTARALFSQRCKFRVRYRSLTGC